MTEHPQISVLVEHDGWTEALADAAVVAEETAAATYHAVRPDRFPLQPVAEVAPARLCLGILLTDDGHVAALNRGHRGKSGPTNVLSFAAFDEPDAVVPPDGPVALGDVAIAFETVRREAGEAGRPLDHHLRHMVAHGVLHILGYDHGSDSEAEVMEDLEREILTAFGVADPYAPEPRSASPDQPRLETRHPAREARTP